MIFILFFFLIFIKVTAAYLVTTHVYMWYVLCALSIFFFLKKLFKLALFVFVYVILFWSYSYFTCVSVYYIDILFFLTWVFIESSS